MDLQQRKLTKSEWESIEIPVSQDEIEILNLIMRGYADVNIKYNKHNSLLSYLKIDKSNEMEDYLYNTYFGKKMKALIEKYDAKFADVVVDAKTKIKKADIIRLEKNSAAVVEKAVQITGLVIYEYILINLVENLLKSKKNKGNWEFYYFTLYKLARNRVTNLNRHVVQIVKQILDKYEDDVDMRKIVENSVDYVEKNENILKYSDIMLYDHQKRLFTASKDATAQLVLYIAPTGTGKTLSPIGLSESKRVIFVCAARHVGLALARAAISVNKKIAFAFGCSSADEIRLHYFAAKEYTRDRRTGGIRKVDNSIGDKVEIMICDIKSYIPAMFYMLAFNKKEDIVTYWDEPTITLDYEEHDFHPIIQKNWSENIIPNMVLSSATLPKVHEISEVIGDFMSRFSGANVISIISDDCKKTIPIIDNNGYVVLPHHIESGYDEMKAVVAHCENYLTLLRYFDLKELVKFISYLLRHNLVQSNLRIERNFSSLDEIDMKTIKLYYLKLLKNIPAADWRIVNQYFCENREKRIKPNDAVDSKGNKIRKQFSVGPGIDASTSASASAYTTAGELKRTSSMQEPQVLRQETTQDNGTCAIYVNTKDAHTLTDGPTIFLANDIEKLAKFCIQQAAIPAVIMTDIIEKIEFNNSVNLKIAKLEKTLEDIKEREKSKDSSGKESSSKKSGKGDHKFNRSEDVAVSGEERTATQELNMLKSMIKSATLNDTYVPNTHEHLNKWAEKMRATSAFRSDIEESTILKIMMLKDVENSWKVLLLMGIGVFTNHESIEYTEIMKGLADQQKLYLIIASSDYIYGTNYQFCHGYLSKDLNLTQEKIIQAMGRMGRTSVQKDYSVRFRDNEQIKKLFSTDPDKPEVANMKRLFVSSV
jgi:hypothetical protein